MKIVIEINNAEKPLTNTQIESALNRIAFQYGKQQVHFVRIGEKLTVMDDFRGVMELKIEE